MKKILFMFAVTLLVSCSSDNEDEEPHAPSNEETIIGKWVKYEQASASTFTNFFDAFSKDTLTFRHDGTYTEVFEGSSTPINGKYTVDNVYLTLSGLWTYAISFDNKETMRLREYGYGKDNSIYRYRRLQ